MRDCAEHRFVEIDDRKNRIKTKLMGWGSLVGINVLKYHPHDNNTPRTKQ